jgi:hypothetical protein
MGVEMNQTPDALWRAFEALANEYPHDDGVRLTADLARWLVVERKLRRIPVPPVLEAVALKVAQDLVPPRRKSSAG